MTLEIRLPWETQGVGCQFVIGNDAYYYARFYTNGYNGMVNYDYQTKKALSFNFPIIKHVSSNDNILIKTADLYNGMHGYGNKPSINDTIGYGNADDYTIIVNGVEHHKTNALLFPIEKENYTIVIQYKNG